MGWLGLLGCAAGSSASLPTDARDEAGAVMRPAQVGDRGRSSTRRAAQADSAEARPAHGVDRPTLHAVLDQGLGRFLGYVRTEPYVVEGRFVGFRIRAMADGLHTDLVRPGDVVMRVNGQRVERPEQAFDVWRSLRSADALCFAILRDGQPREPCFPVVD